jgi:non-homologous end joining protein Ku
VFGMHQSARPPISPLPKESILKGFETEQGRYAVVAPREIAALRAKTSTELEILEFSSGWRKSIRSI